MDVPSTVGSWDAEDDSLLKNAVEAGASLESLAKGAVCFSRKFTLQDLQDRWRSLLYDSGTSSQASARIVEFETYLSTSSPGKTIKRFNSKGKVYSRRKRKIDSVKYQYYSRRKRVCLSAAFGYAVAPCSCIPDGSGCVCSGLLEPSEDHRSVHTLDPATFLVNNYGHIDESYGSGQDVHHKDNKNYLFHPNNANAAGSILIDGNINDDILHDCSGVGQPYRSDNVQKNPQSGERNIAPLKDLPDLQDYANPQQPVLDDQSGNGVTGSKILDTFASMVNGISDSGLDNAPLSENESMHACFINCGQSKDFELLNGKNILGSALDTDQDDFGDFSAEVVTEDISTVYLLGLSDSHANHIYPIHKKHSTADVYGTDIVPTLSEAPFSGCSIECRLNTEDSEIPCNDDALMHGQPPLECTSTSNQNSHHIMCLASMESTPSENAADFNHFDSVEDVQPSSATMKMEPSTFEDKENMVALTEACNLGSEPSVIFGDIAANNAIKCIPTFHHSAKFGKEKTRGLVQHECFSNFRNLTLNIADQVSDQISCKFLADRPDIGCETAIQNCMSSHGLPDMEFHNPIATMSSLDQAEGGSDDENCVPNYFDIEALILNQDLIPWDQESDFIQPEVSRFQHLESRKDLIRLEQGARSYMNRSIMFEGAFAIIYGRYLKYYIKDPEVSLGRETEEVHVDIDLAKEGNANKISRRQAVIKMDEVGSFHIKNIGKYPIFVNGKEVPSNKRINLISDALLEIRGMKFIFHVDPEAVRQYIVDTRRGSSQGKKTAFDWDKKP